MEFIWVPIWIALAVALGFVASSRGRSVAGWGFCALLFSPLILLIVLLCMDDLRKLQLERELADARARQAPAPRPALNSWAPSPPASPAAPASRAPAVPAVPALAPQLVAAELERLSALVDRGRLTDEEYAEMKLRLLGKSPAAPAESTDVGLAAAGLGDSAAPDSARPTALEARRADLMDVLAEPERAVPRLESHGCRVRKIAPEAWEVVEPGGLTIYCRSKDALQTLAVDVAMGLRP